MSRQRAPECCANCGAQIPPQALACPECGADERTGWREQSLYDGLDLPEEAFDDGENAQAAKPLKGKAWLWWMVALVMLVVVLVLALRGRF